MARLFLPEVTTGGVKAGHPCRAPAARRARGAERERAHSWSKRRRVRAVSARLEDVQKLLTGIKELDWPAGWDLMRCGVEEPDLPRRELNP